MPGLDEEMAEWITAEGSEYIVTLNGDEVVSEEVTEAIEVNYTEVFANEDYTLYRRNS